MSCCFRQPKGLHMRIKIESSSQFVLKSLAVVKIVIFTCLISCVDDILKQQRLLKLPVST